MFSLFTGLYTASVGGNQVEGRYYATPSTTSKLDLPRVLHADEKSQRSGTRTVVICVERFVSTHSTPLLRASRGSRTVDFLISKIEYGEYRDKLVDKRDKIRVRASLFIELKKKKLESDSKAVVFRKDPRTTSLIEFLFFFFFFRNDHLMPRSIFNSILLTRAR